MADINYHGPVVAFDLDDTLFRERDFCRSGFRFLCDPERYRIPNIRNYPSSGELAQLVEKMDVEIEACRNPFTPFADFFLKRTDNGKFDIQTHINAYRNHLPENLGFAEGVEETLENFADRGFRMALITDGRSATQRRKIEALGLKRFISPDMFLISEETGVDKHSSQMFATVVRFFPEAKEFYYIGDNPLKDFYHPNLLGWTSIQIPYHPDNVHPQCEPESPLHLPRLTVDKFLDLIEIIH